MKLVDEIRIKKTARRAYGWVIWAAPLGFVILVASELIDNDLLGWAVFLLVPWLVWLAAKEKFIKRHAQQALILVGLTGFALWNVVDSNGEEWLWFAAAVWIGGTAWGRWQVQHGACMLMALRGEEEELPSDQSIKDLERMVREGKEDHTEHTQPRAAPVEPAARGAEMTLEEEIRVKKMARKVYNWLFFSPLLAGPCFLYYADFVGNGGDMEDSLFAAAMPLLAQLPLLMWASSSDKFVKRHAQQALLLVLAMAVAAFVLAMAFGGEGIAGFILIGGLIWLVGVFKGGQQVNEGTCTLMTRFGEEEELPGNLSIQELERMAKEAQLAERKDPVASSMQVVHQPPAAAPSMPTTVQPARPPRVAELLDIFQHGNPAARKQAVEKLAALGEVEVF